MEKNRKTRGVPWADLPQEILGLILPKLQSAVDVIRFRAVCKSWHIIDDDMPKDHRNLPWLCNFDWSNKNRDVLECEMYDPYSRQIFKTSKFVESRRYTTSNYNSEDILPASNYNSEDIICLGSNQGWLIAANNYDNKWEIFMYNPYTKDYIPLPFISSEYCPCFATLSGNPVSCNDSRVFLLLSQKFGCDDFYDIATYGLNGGDKEWEIDDFDDDEELFYLDSCCGMQYVNEQLFFLHENGRITRYNLADKSQIVINLDEGSRQFVERPWLAQGGAGDILVACGLSFGRTECSTFYFDCCNMSWIGSDRLLESIAIFISGHITTFVRPFEDKDDVENNKSCKVYFFDEAQAGCRKEPSDYSFEEMRKRGKSSVFMEPPRIN